MWLTAKNAASDPAVPKVRRGRGVRADPKAWQPASAIDQYDQDLAWFNQEGLPDSIKQWAQQNHDDNPFNPNNETQVDHAKRLRDFRDSFDRAKNDWETAEIPAGDAVPATAVVDRTPDLAISDKPALMRRVPGEDLKRNPPPPMSGRDLPRRTPLGRDPSQPSYAPRPQSHIEWLQDMGQRGIFVDSDGNRVQPRRPTPGPPRGHDIWGEFTRPESQPEDDSLHSALKDLPEDQGGLGKSWKQKAKDFIGRRRASVEVTDYIGDVLSNMDGD